MGARSERLKRAVYVGRVARRSALLRVLRELGVWGNRPATREGAAEFRRALEELGTTYIELGQLLSSRPDLLPEPALRVAQHAAPAARADAASRRPPREQAGDGHVQGRRGRVGGALIIAALLIASALVAQVHDLRYAAFGLFCAAFVLALYMM